MMIYLVENQVTYLNYQHYYSKDDMEIELIGIIGNHDDPMLVEKLDRFDVQHPYF